jgi:hypothetical protein
MFTYTGNYLYLHDNAVPRSGMLSIYYFLLIELIRSCIINASTIRNTINNKKGARAVRFLVS